ncbi:hypothetical protein LJR225_004284 [Phenylobacterium sp. LjRoot225]|uniref:hypothetical protein n=1 Tax=Phenylobacterium sp. LjRoot225 TaxID=3342285 RepID=UPI003ECD26A7
MRASPLLLVVSFLPLAAHAGETRCWFEGGVLVVPAEVMGLAGDYVLDTGAPHTLMAETQAQGAGFAEVALRGDIRLAGLALRDRPVQVVKLDSRLRPLPTPVAGVIGADVLVGRVLDVSFAPCRVALHEPGQAPPFAHAVTLPLVWREGRPVTAAAVADGRRAWAGDFVPATGSDTPVRLRDDLADAPGAVRHEALYPYGATRPRLRALSFAGDLFEDPASGLTAKAELDAAGEIGAPVLARYRLRFDFVRGELLLAHEKGPPDRSGGP